jgi:hypothetical protein
MILEFAGTGAARPACNNHNEVGGPESMSASSLEPALAASRTGSIAKVLWLLVLAIGAYFVLAYVARYLVQWNETTYGSFWPRLGYFVPHMLGGLVAIVLGPLQFWPRIRNRHPKVHRVTGRVYLSGVLVSALGGIGLALTTAGPVAYAAGLFALSVAWLLTSSMAFFAIKRRDFVQHKEWMIRSYVVTFSFVTFRIVTDVLAAAGIGERAVNFTLMSWAAWALPLLVTEAVIQGRKIRAAR